MTCITVYIDGLFYLARMVISPWWPIWDACLLWHLYDDLVGDEIRCRRTRAAWFKIKFCLRIDRNSGANSNIAILEFAPKFLSNLKQNFTWNHKSENHLYVQSWIIQYIFVCLGYAVIYFFGEPQWIWILEKVAMYVVVCFSSFEFGKHALFIAEITTDCGGATNVLDMYKTVAAPQWIATVFAHEQWGAVVRL